MSSGTLAIFRLVEMRFVAAGFGNGLWISERFGPGFRLRSTQATSPETRVPEKP
jgi:hypothetical protein